MNSQKNACIYQFNIEDLPKYEEERKEIEKELNKRDKELKTQYKKFEDINHKIFCCQFNYYFTES